MVSALTAVLGLAVAGPSAAATAPENVVHRRWTVEDGLPQSSVNALVERRDGSLWIGTFGGLARFDGTAFRVMPLTTDDGPPRLRILSLLEDLHGRLWVGTEEAGVGVLSDGRFTTVAELAGEVAAGLAEDAAGRVWVAGLRHGLAVVDPDTGEVSRPPLDGFRPHTVAAAPGGAVWAGGRGLLHRVGPGGSVATFGAADGLPDSLVLDIEPSTRGGVWLATDGHGVVRFDGGVAEQYVPAGGLGSHHVWSVAEDRSGALWVGGYGGSVRRVTNRRIEPVRTGAELAGGPVRVLLEDSSGSIWIGTSSAGLHRLSEPLFDVWNRSTGGLPTDSVLAVTEDRDGVVWAGLNCGGIARIDDGDVGRITMAGVQPGDCVWSLLAARDGSLWFGSWGGGLGRIVDGRLERPVAAPALGTGAAVLALFEDRDGAIWIGTRTGGAFRWREGRLDRYRAADGLPGDDVRCFAEDRRGRVWIGTTRGLGRVTAGRVDRLDPEVAWRGTRVRALYADGAGRLWIGTYGSGLGLVRDGRGRRFDRRHGLIDPVVSAIVEDDRGHLWLTGNQGIFRVPVAELLEVADGRRSAVVPAAFGTGHGLPTVETSGGFQPAAWRARDGTLYFPTIRGLVSIRPSRLERGRPPQAWIEEVLVDGSAVPLDADGTRIPSGHSRVEIRFGGLSLGSPGAITFRYRLDGVDPDWIPTGRRRSAVYHRLGAGSFRFVTEALTAEGGWSEPASVELEVPRALWLQPWFLVAAGLAVVVVPAAAVRWRAVRRERRLREHASAIRRLSVGIVHEFRQPLQVLEARLEILARSAPGERPRRSVEQARVAVERLRTLADRIEHLHGEGPLPTALYAGDEMMVDLGEGDGR